MFQCNSNNIDIEFLLHVVKKRKKNIKYVLLQLIFECIVVKYGVKASIIGSISTFFIFQSLTYFLGRPFCNLSNRNKYLKHTDTYQRYVQFKCVLNSYPEVNTR